MDWSRFSFEYRLDLSDFLPLLIRIEGRKEAAMNLYLPSEWKEGLDLLNRVRTIHGSTALEGNPLSETQVGQFLQGKIGLDPLSRDMRQIQNADAAQEWVRRRFGPGRAPIRLEDILQMHELMTRLSDETNNVPGHLRNHDVQVGTPELGGVHVGAPCEDLPGLMAGFVSFVNSARLKREHPVVRALLAHFFPVTIHPFGDGNGRVSRLVEAAILYEGGYNIHGFYGLSNYFYRNGDEYKRRLQESRRVQPFDMAPFVVFGLHGFEAELEGINNFIKTKMNRLVYRDTITNALGHRVSKRRHLLNAREYQLLRFLLEETEPQDPFSEVPSERVRLDDLVNSPFVRSTYRDVTNRTFRRELTRLAELGFIVFDHLPDSGEYTVEIDFGVIERDFEEIGSG